MTDDWDYEAYNPITGIRIERFSFLGNGTLESEYHILDRRVYKVFDTTAPYDMEKRGRAKKMARTPEEIIKAIKMMAMCDVRPATEDKEPSEVEIHQ